MANEIKPGSSVYTYRNGKKVYLKKQPDKIVVRAKPEELAAIGISKNLEKVSPASTRITLSSEILDATMNELRNKITTHHAYNREDNGSEFLITDRILVTFKSLVSNKQIDDFASKYSLFMLEKYSEKEFLFQLTDHTGMNPVKLVVLINESEKNIIESCEHDLNKRVKVYSLNLPSDAKYIQQWHLHKRLSDPAFDPRSSSNCEGAWQTLNNFGSNDVVIGITDDGCKISHPDFDSVNKFANWGYMSGSSLVTRDSVSGNPDNMYEEGSDHGTCCSGVITAEVDAVLTVGAAPACKLLPVKWEAVGEGLNITDSKMMTVLNFIADKVDVLSNSWGASPESNFAVNVVNKIATLAQTGGRRGKGIVFLWASGNENCPIQFSGNMDIPFDNGIEIRQDGSAIWIGVNKSKVFEHNTVGIPGVMHIAALASNAQRSHYSNYGEGISICAPTNNVHEYWRLTVTGLGITTASGTIDKFTDSFGGTSSATPLVAGIAGLVISANPQLSALEVISVLQKTASKDLNMTAYAKTPPSSFDSDTSWDVSPVMPFNAGDFKNINHSDGTWSPWFGFGRVDAEAAVAEAIRLSGGAVSDSILSKSSSPGKSIPDNNPIGITDGITVSEQGSVSSLKIDLDISHTYIGDLVIQLLSPKGTAVILHNRNGSSAKNISKTFDVLNTPALSVLNGENISGDWTLQITDMAAIDIGTLNNWKLQIGLSADQSVMLDDSPGITIPDNNPVGIERSLNTANAGTIKDVQVSIDITHSYIGDLIVNLVSPKGSIIPLHNRAGGSADNIIKTFNFTNNLDLKLLKGEKVQGDWKLKVSDIVGQDIGKLNKWSLKFVKE